MDDDLKKVFISYRRRVSSWFARDVFRHLREHEYDVFMDVVSIDGGPFPDIINRQIEARPHFLLLLEEGSFPRVATEGDWLRREIEHALDTERNIVPLLSNFTLDHSEFRSTLRSLPDKFARLADMQAVTFFHEYVDAAFERLRTRSLKVRPKGRVTPTPAAEQPAVAQMVEQAASATPDDATGGWTLLTGVQLILREKDGALEWNQDAAAEGYTLERSTGGEFSGDVVYTGPARTWRVSPAARGAWFRVRAEGGSSGLMLTDPSWSTPVYVASPSDFLSTPSTAPAAPRLIGSESPSLPGPLARTPKRSLLGEDVGYTLSWGSSLKDAIGHQFDMAAVPGRDRKQKPFGEPADMAVLEKLEYPRMRGSIIYAGCRERFVDTAPPTFGCSYRVQLIDIANRKSSWSNVVERKGLIGKPRR